MWHSSGPHTIDIHSLWGVCLLMAFNCIMAVHRLLSGRRHFDDDCLSFCRPQWIGSRSTKFLLVVKKTSLHSMKKQRTRYILNCYKNFFLSKGLGFKLSKKLFGLPLLARRLKQSLCSRPLYIITSAFTVMCIVMFIWHLSFDIVFQHNC